MARNAEFEVGDKVVVVESTNFGIKITQVGIVMGIGYGWGANRGCWQGKMYDYAKAVENNRYMILAVPEYNKETGTQDWERYSAKKSNVMLDRESIRAIDEVTRGKIREHKWQQEAREIERTVEREVMRKLVSQIFPIESWQHAVEIDEIAPVLLAKGIVQPINREEFLNERLQKALKEFNKSEEESAPAAL